jgi:hypothetical protein
VSCRHNLGIEIDRNGNVHELALDDDAPSCALDVAAKGELTLEEIGQILNVTREGVRLIERAALVRFVQRARAAGVVGRLPYFGEGASHVAERAPEAPRVRGSEVDEETDTPDDDARTRAVWPSFFDGDHEACELTEKIYVREAGVDTDNDQHVHYAHVKRSDRS